MKISRCLYSLLCVFTMMSFQIASADPFVDAVSSVEYGDGAGFGQDRFPEVVFGPPIGAGENTGSLDVLSLGDGGVITLEFTDNIALNGPGPDLIIFENAFFIGGDPSNTFAEVAFIEVSSDGETFYRFPNDYDPSGTPVNNPDNWSGFAGVFPVLSNPENEIDPTDPGSAGGDVFDLDDVGLDQIRYVRIIDTNEPPDAMADDDGDEIYDPGYSSGESSGFDLDAIAAVYSVELTTPTPTFTSTPVNTLKPVATPIPTTMPTPSATPTNTNFDVNFDLSQQVFSAGDHFVLNLYVDNQLAESINANLVIMLDVKGEYFFWPSWSTDFDASNTYFTPGNSSMEILNFIWPDGAGAADGLMFMSALFNHEMVLVSNIASVEFEYY